MSKRCPRDVKSRSQAKLSLMVHTRLVILGEVLRDRDVVHARLVILGEVLGDLTL